MRKILLTAGVLTAVLLSGCVKDTSLPSDTTGASTNQANPIAEEASSDFVPDEVLIKFKSGTSQTGILNALARISGKVKEHVVTGAMKLSGDNEGFYVVQAPVGVMTAIDKIKDVTEVEYAEPNYIMHHTPLVPLADASDPYYSGDSYKNDNLWGMMGETTSPYKNKYGSRAGEAWANGKTNASTVYVAIIDEGIQYTHPELSTNIWTNPFDAPDGVDNDNNGYKDDVHGWDFANNDAGIYDAGADDHGTHVAGTIGAVGDNGEGVAGVCWKVNIISAKFLGPNGGSLSNAVKALDYVTNLKIAHGLNIVATNNSWGGGSFSQSLLDAITRGAKNGILFIAAAGNGNMVGIGQNNDKKANYPSNYNTKGQTGGSGTACDYDAVIAVASISVDGSKSGFSNYGLQTVDIAAPGSYIWSTVPSSTYAKYSGTSMATPHVTGAVALYASVNTGKTAAQIKQAILNSARPTKSFQRLTVTGGRLDVNSALQNMNNAGLQAD